MKSATELAAKGLSMPLLFSDLIEFLNEASMQDDYLEKCIKIADIIS